MSRKFETDTDYLCVTGVVGVSNQSVAVGRWNGRTFEFSNGAYGNTDLYYVNHITPIGLSNATRVLKARKVEL